MSEFYDLETGEKCRDEAHENELYRAGHRIKVYHDGKPWMEWIPGSNNYYMFDTGKRRLVKYNEGAFRSSLDAFIKTEPLKKFMRTFKLKWPRQPEEEGV